MIYRRSNGAGPVAMTHGGDGALENKKSERFAYLDASRI